MKRNVVVLGLIVAVMAGVMAVRGDRELRPDASAEIEREHALRGHPGARLAADAVLAISPRVASVRPSSAAPVPKLSPAMQEYTFAKAYQPIYERLKAAPSRSPEQTWILAKILEECGRLADRQDGVGSSRNGDEAIARFDASLSPKDPQRAKRIAAFRVVNTDRCEGVREVSTSESEIRDLLTQSAAAGDPKAAADLVFKNILARFRTQKDGSASGSIAEAEVETLKHSIESGDPTALTGAMAALLLPVGNLSLRAGPDERPVETSAMFGAAQLMACDLGAACGPDSTTLLNACARQGRCDGASLREYLFYYVMSPETSQQVVQYESYIAQVVKNHDWSAFTFFHGPRPDIAPFVNR